MVDARKDSTEQPRRRDPIPVGPASPPASGASTARPPLGGYNHDINHGGRRYHVQTEDLGAQRAIISSQVYLGGAVVGAATRSYIDLAAQRGHEPQLRRLMQAQHRGLIKQLAAGGFDGRIAELSGELFPPPDPFATTIPAPSLAAAYAHCVDPSVPAKRVRSAWRRALSPLLTVALLAISVWAAVHLAQRRTSRAEPIADESLLEVAPLAPTTGRALPEPAAGIARHRATEPARGTAPTARPTAVASLRPRPPATRRSLSKGGRLQRQTRRAIRRHLSLARRALARRRWREAEKEASTVLRLRPRHRQARAIKRRAEAKIRRIKRRRRTRRQRSLVLRSDQRLRC